ncbi:hypothetical protein JHK84_040454 [Glycine max]|nr:hypothetical protein JHK84_040454 [Glycine max]
MILKMSYKTEYLNLGLGAKGSEFFDKTLVEDLTKMVDQFNCLAKHFRKVRDFVEVNARKRFCLRLYRDRSKDPHVYNILDTYEVVALIVRDLDNTEFGRDIVVKSIFGQLQWLHETHTSFIPLQYSLFFPYGKDGFQEDIPISQLTNDRENCKRMRVTLRE